MTNRLKRFGARALEWLTSPAWGGRERLREERNGWMEALTEDDWAEVNREQAAIHADMTGVPMADFAQLADAFMHLYLQGLNGVVCNPDREPGRYGCSACLDAWKQGNEVIDRYDPKAGNLYRTGPIFQPGASDA